MRETRPRWFQALSSTVGRRKLSRRLRVLQVEVDQHPRDPRLRQQLGELHRKLDNRDQAAVELIRAAHLLDSRGFARKAESLLRQADAIRFGHAETSGEVQHISFQSLETMRPAS